MLRPAVEDEEAAPPAAVFLLVLPEALLDVPVLGVVPVEVGVVLLPDVPAAPDAPGVPVAPAAPDG